MGGCERLDRSWRAPRWETLIRWLATAFLLGTIAVLSACGNSDRPPGLTGPTGGTSGTGGESSGSGGAAAGDSGGGTAGGTSGSAGSMSGAGGSGMPGPACIPRQGCQTLCTALAADPSACGLGNDEQCGCICEERFNGPCSSELDALLACTGPAPSVECSSQGRIFSGCESESVALDLCDFRAREQLCAQSYPRCTPYCQAATLSYCSRGPESVTSCLCGCEASLATTCATAFEAFMTCSGDAPDFSCDGSGQPTPTSCSAEWQAVLDCVSPGAAPGPDGG